MPPKQPPRSRRGACAGSSAGPWVVSAGRISSPPLRRRGGGAFMDDDRFWEIIDASRAGSGPDRYQAGRDEQIVRLHRLLSALSVEEVRAFLKLFSTHMGEAYGKPREGLWGVAFDIAGGCSDDMFDDFRSWLISMGRAVFEAA